MKYEMSGKYEIAAAIIEVTIEKKPAIKSIEHIPTGFQIVAIESIEYELCEQDEKERNDNLKGRKVILDRRVRLTCYPIQIMLINSRWRGCIHFLDGRCC